MLLFISRLTKLIYILPAATARWSLPTNAFAGKMSFCTGTLVWRIHSLYEIFTGKLKPENLAVVTWVWREFEPHLLLENQKQLFFHAMAKRNTKKKRERETSDSAVWFVVAIYIMSDKLLQNLWQWCCPQKLYIVTQNANFYIILF